MREHQDIPSIYDTDWCARRRLITLRRVIIFLLIIVILAIPVSRARSLETMTTYRVVHTGDSISAMSWGMSAPGVVLDSRQWRNLEHGRNIYTAGQAGVASTASIWPLILARSQRGGYIVIQDNSYDTPQRLTDDSLRRFFAKIARETPNDRTLVVVLPGYLASVNPIVSATIARRATIIGQEIMRDPTQPRRFVYLNRYMLAHPEQFPDGQHPNATAQAWIRRQITSYTGGI